jgi:hypothetical protein
LSTNTGHIYTLKHGPENTKLYLSDAPKNAQIEQEIAIKIIRFPPYLLLPGESKLRNAISQPILATFIQ